MTVTPLVSSDVADESVSVRVEAMLAKLAAVDAPNRLKQAYYESEAQIRKSPIIPAAWQEFRQVAGWAGTVVDVLEERLDWQGWVGDESGVLDEVFDVAGLGAESSLAHLDALIFGTAFVVMDPHAAEDGVSDLVTAETPLRMTGVWDPQTRELECALLVTSGQSVQDATEIAWWDTTQTGHLTRAGGLWRWKDHRPHTLGRCPVVQLVNRPRASRLGGRSEISLPVRYYVDTAVRTMAALETNRDFYSYPQRWGTNIPADAMTTPDGEDVPGWVTAMSAMNVIDPPAAGAPEPKLGQFAANPPTPYLQHLEGLATLLSAEAAIPQSYLGFVTDNPASADAIRAGEARLVKRSERRQTSFGSGWRKIGELILAAHGTPGRVGCQWRDAATPTVAATADATTKLIAAQVFPARSKLVYNRLGLSPAEQKQLEADWAGQDPDPIVSLAAAVSRQGA